MHKFWPTHWACSLIMNCISGHGNKHVLSWWHRCPTIVQRLQLETSPDTTNKIATRPLQQYQCVMQKHPINKEGEEIRHQIIPRDDKIPELKEECLQAATHTLSRARIHQLGRICVQSLRKHLQGYVLGY